MASTDTGWSTGLLDDAAVLPPTSRPLAPTVRAHHDVRRGDRGSLVGALCTTEQELPHLATGDLPVHLAVTGGAGALEAALRWVSGPGSDRVTVRRVSVRLRGEQSGPGLTHNARRVVTVLDSVQLPDDVAVYAAPPEPLGGPSPAWLAALDELAAREIGLLLPATAPWTASALDAALDRELPLAFEARTAADVVAALVGVRTALDGAPPPDGWLGDTADADLPQRTRRWCRAVLVPDVAQVIAELNV